MTPCLVRRRSFLSVAALSVRPGLCVLLSATAAGCAGYGRNDDGAASGSSTPLLRESLEGFVVVLDSPWTVEANGVVASRQNPAGRLEGESWLLSRKHYEDFVLTLRFRIDEGGNSGVFVRVPMRAEERLAAADGGSKPWEAGYEVNINGTHPEYPTGSVWALAAAPPGLQREGEWNDLEIKVVGNRLWSRVNGEVAVDGVTLPERPDAPTSTESGAIGFQRHGGAEYRDKLIEIRDVAITELPRPGFYRLAWALPFPAAPESAP